MVNASPGFQSSQSPSSYPIYRLKNKDLELLHKFQTRTSFTIGTEDGNAVFRDDVFNMSLTRPFLLHVILTLTLRHDRFLSASPTTKPTTAEAYHWYQGTSLFNSALSKIIKHSDKDALWATAAILGAIAFSCLETSGPEEAWPLKPRDTSDLDWLKMSDGKKAVFKLAEPLRPDSVFRSMHTQRWDEIVPSSTLGPEFKSLPPEFMDIYELERIPAEQNPYFSAISLLAQLMTIECNHKTILKFLSFIGQLDPALRMLFEEKEPRALLLLAWWFAKLCQYHQWWIWRRSIMECQAICIYLDRFHQQETDIIQLLSYPKTMCGLFNR
ncbi:MAG: hypothetical protein MMC23_007736 [Stictis urceolatum]|nr:hypothetical protein [Stictis urceolata]